MEDILECLTIMTTIIDVSFVLELKNLQWYFHHEAIEEQVLDSQ